MSFKSAVAIKLFICLIATKVLVVLVVLIIVLVILVVVLVLFVVAAIYKEGSPLVEVLLLLYNN
jgi:hypothetical protein